jgi:glycosyltransferase involved in cell wall biosynthesis
MLNLSGARLLRLARHPQSAPTLRRVRRTIARVPPLLGAPSRELLAMHSLAMLVTDWSTALAAADRRLERSPEDEGALVARAVALWELGRESEARATVALDESASAAHARAAVRFHHHLDEPAGAQAALDLLADPAPALVLAVGRAWRRHGELRRAVAAADAVLARAPGDPFASSLRRKAQADRRVLDGAWKDARPSVRLEPAPRRILHMLQRSLPEHRSGSTYRTYYTAQAQAGAGLEPHIVTQPGFGVPLTSHEGVPVHRLAAAPGPRDIDERLAVYLGAASRVVEAVRPAALHPASDYVNGVVAIELGRRHGLPVVYEVRGFPEVLQGRWAGSRASYERSVVRRELEAACWRDADAVVTLAEVMKRHIAGHGVDPDRIVVVPNGVDPDVFRPQAPDPRLRAALGIRTGELVVGYVSTLVSYEGLQYLVEAVARLADGGVPARAVIVGDGPEREALAQLARRLGVADRVRLTGRIAHDRVAAYYAQLDVFVVPRTNEQTTRLVTPLKPYEAMACGKAVLVSRIPALREMVREGETGLTFTPEDPDDLARVLGGLARDGDAVAALGRQARDWVVAHRAWAGNAERYLELYRRLGAV